MQLEEMTLLCLDTSFQPSFSSVTILFLHCWIRLFFPFCRCSLRIARPRFGLLSPTLKACSLRHSLWTLLNRILTSPSRVGFMAPVDVNGLRNLTLVSHFFGCWRSGTKISRALVQSHLRRATQTFPSRIRGISSLSKSQFWRKTSFHLSWMTFSGLTRFGRGASEFANSDPRDSYAGNWPLEKVMIGPFTLLGDNATFDIPAQIPIQTGGSVPPNRLRVWNSTSLSAESWVGHMTCAWGNLDFPKIRGSWLKSPIAKKGTFEPVARSWPRFSSKVSANDLLSCGRQ